jgi:hypothetical protein
VGLIFTSLILSGAAAAAIMLARRGNLALFDRWWRRRLLPDVEVNANRIGPARTAFAEAAQVLGLEHQARGMSFVLAGQHDGFYVHVEPLGLIIGEGHGVADVRVTLDGERCVRPELWLHSRTANDLDRDPHGRRPVPTGDEQFDARFGITGPEALVRALLGRRHRRSLLQLDGFLSVKEGRVIYTARCLPKGKDGIVEAIQNATALTRSLSIEKDAVLDQLLDNAIGDPTPGVRLLNLLVLIREHRSSSDVESACRRLLTDPVAAVRLEAAIALGLEGHATCVRIADDRSSGPAVVRARAIRHLARNLAFEDALPVLIRALGDPDREVRHSAIKSLGKLERPEVVAPLMAQLRTADDEETRAIAFALGRVRTSTAELALLRLLDHRALDVQSAAITSLGRVGTPASVPTLASYKERAPTSLRRTVDDTIEAIKARARAEPGRLSFVEGPDGGALSVADAPVGSLSPPASPTTE